MITLCLFLVGTNVFITLKQHDVLHTLRVAVEHFHSGEQIVGVPAKSHLKPSRRLITKYSYIVL